MAYLVAPCRDEPRHPQEADALFLLQNNVNGASYLWVKGINDALWKQRKGVRLGSMLCQSDLVVSVDLENQKEEKNL